MRTVALGLTLLCAAVAGAIVAQAGSERIAVPAAELQELVLAERAFARASIERGMRDAFLEHLAADSVIFRPGPVAGRPWFEQRPPGDGTLSWEPLFADVSRGADLGYTTGPWQFTPGEGEPAFGHYVSIWKKQTDGSWRVALDIGISHPRIEGRVGDLGFPPRGRRPANRATGGSNRGGAAEALLEAERSYTRRSTEQGPGAACTALAGKTLRLFREGVPPVEGKRAACAALEQSRAPAGSAVAGSGLADSSDLGYTYGDLDFEPGEDGEDGGPGSFLRIWKRSDEGEWKLVLEVSVPHPRS